jgi:replicative DNA helicase
MASFNPELEIEKAVLAAMLLEQPLQIVGFLNLADKHFSNESYRLIFQAMLKLRDTSLPIDLVTVVHQLRKDGNLDKVGGAYEIAEIATRVNSGANMAGHICIMKENYINREIDRIEKSSTKDIPDAHERLQALNKELTELSLIYEVASSVEGSKPMDDTLLSILERKPLHLVFGLNSIDRSIRGINKGELVVIAARPSMGKTDFSLFLSLEFCKQKKHVVFISLEMSAEELLKRIAQFILKTDDLSLSKMDINQYGEVMKYYNAYYADYLHIIDGGNINADYIAAKAAEFKTKYPEDFGAVVIDYLGMIETNIENPTEAITKITYKMKKTAKQFQVPVVLLCQLNRNVEHRADRIPNMADLRQSGSIEQDADTVLLLHREDYYQRNNKDFVPTLMLTVIAAKVRKGAVGNFELHYNPATKVIADSEPINTPVKEIYNVNPSTGEVFKTLDGKTTIDDFNSDKPTPF